MDSMRSLNKSLPSARSTKQPPPEDLLPAFRQAALSVTNLYKSAASYHDSIRQAGYQDALDDLLNFLDKENIGLQDGEGWRTRQWIAARYDVSRLQQDESEEEDQPEDEQRNRDSSPEKFEDEPHRQQPQQDNHNAADQSQSTTQEPPQQLQEPQQSPFRFSAGQENTMQTDDAQSSNHDPKSAPLKVEVVNRINRNSHRHSNRHPARTGTRAIAQAAGSKRKMPFPDISEIFNVGSFDKKDGHEGGNGAGSGSGSKRSRVV